MSPPPSREMRARPYRPPSRKYCRFTDKGILVYEGNSLGHSPNSGRPGPLRTSFDRCTQSIFTRNPHCADRMGPVDVFLRVSFAGFAAILATVSVKSYARHRERRFLLLGAAFGIFLAQGVWLLVEMATLAVPSVGADWLALNLAVLCPCTSPSCGGEMSEGRELA